GAAPGKFGKGRWCHTGLPHESFVHGSSGLIVLVVDGEQGRCLGALADLGVAVQLQEREEVDPGTCGDQTILEVLWEAQWRFVSSNTMHGVLNDQFYPVYMYFVVNRSQTLL